MTLQPLLHALGWQHAYAASRVGVSPSWMGYWCRGTNMRGNPCVAPEWVLDYFWAVLMAVDEVEVPKNPDLSLKEYHHLVWRERLEKILTTKKPPRQ